MFCVRQSSVLSRLSLSSLLLISLRSSSVVLETGEWRRCRSLPFTPPASLRSHGSRPRPTRHSHLTQNTPHRFNNGATFLSKVISHSIILLLIVYNFSAVCTTIILKWLKLFIAAVGLMLASVVLGPVIAACSYILLLFFRKKIHW